jgi:hypothetical protein
MMKASSSTSATQSLITSRKSRIKKCSFRSYFKSVAASVGSDRVSINCVNTNTGIVFILVLVEVLWSGLPF